MVHRRENEMKFFVVFFGKTCYIKNNGFIMLSQRWTICDVVFGSLNLKMYLKKIFQTDSGTELTRQIAFDL